MEAAVGGSVTHDALRDLYAAVVMLALQGPDSRIPDGPECDVCVVGTGPAGSTIARELSNTALRVVVLESGGSRAPARSRRAERDREHRLASKVGPVARAEPDPRRKLPHVVGPLLAIRSHRFRGARLGPVLGMAIQTTGSRRLSGPGAYSPRAFDERIPEDKFLPRARPDGIASIGVAPMVWRYSSDPENPREPMRFGRRLTEQIGSNVLLLTNSTAVAIRTRPDGPTVEHVEFADRMAAGCV